MSVRPAAPGIQLGSGRLRVDAARAIKKLREYQLADRSAWVLEAIRAAVAAKATRIALRGDSNDIWLEWHGPAWDAELLPRLFDELVSPEPVAELQHVRLLAGAVNSALGMNPAYVDVYAISAAGTAKRVRYTPDVLAEPEPDTLGEAPLRHVAIEDAKPPSEVTTGMLVHLRRRMSIDVLKYWMGRPPEIATAIAACGDISVPLHVGGLELHRDKTTDIVRIPLGEGLDGFVAISHRPTHKATLFEVAERGVVLARYELDLHGYKARAPLPIRIFLDADRLPTNAARSQVRQDVHPISSAERAAKKLLAPLIAELATKVEGNATARLAALHLLASNIAGPTHEWNDTQPLLEPLAKVPILKNAFGQPRWLHTAWREEIHPERGPLDAKLAQWLGEHVWLPPGDEARVLLGDHVVDARRMRQLARAARVQRRAHEKFLAHAQRPLKVETTETPRVRYEIGVPVAGSCVWNEAFHDIKGEICVYYGGRDGALVALLEGRQLERIEMDSPIPFDAVLDYKDLTPGDRYRGVKRNLAYQRVDRAMRAGIVRAVEHMLVKQLELSPLHFTLRGDPTVEHDMQLVRNAIILATSLRFDVTGPLVDAPAWETIGGERVSLAQLRKERVIGIVDADSEMRQPANRIVVRGDKVLAAELRKLVEGRVVNYDKAAGAKERVTSSLLASGVVKAGRTACLAITDGELVGLVALAPNPLVHLRHMGVPLGQHTYKHALYRCAIVVDSDRVVPNDAWNGVIEDAGLTGRSYRDWERALLRAIATTLCGLRPPELMGPERIGLDDENGGALVAVLQQHDPAGILGKDLLASLMAAPIFALLGSKELYSIDDIAAKFPDAIPYVSWDVKPLASPGFAGARSGAEGRRGVSIDDFAPLVASDVTAKFVARLAGRAIVDGVPELQRRQKKALFMQRYATHRDQPERVMELPGEMIQVPVNGSIAQGRVGLGNGVFEIRVFVDKRPFTVLHPKQEFPLLAVVAVDASTCSETFDGLPSAIADAVTGEVLDAVHALVEELATKHPRELGLEPGKSFLAEWLAKSPPPTKQLRAFLFEAQAFRSIQGPTISLSDAAQPRLILQTASWSDTWLGPGDGESESALDAPILAVGGAKDSLHTIIEHLHEHAVTDLTPEVGRLQARRRMARGLLPTPKLGGIPDAFKRELKHFGEPARKLGHGELGLITGAQSSVLVHEQGQLQRTVDIDVMPAVQLAVEEPHEHYSFEQLRGVLQQLALDLVRGVLAANPKPPQQIVRNLASAVLANRIPPALVGSLPLFVTTTGVWIDWDTFSDQKATFGNVWAVTSPPMVPMQPLDPARIVIVLGDRDIALAVQNGHVVINAKVELELDHKARVNQAKPKAVSLELPSREGVLVEVELDGDGTSGPRGRVAVLDPTQIANRGAYVYRGMHPLGRVDDVCRWPSIAVVDDVRVTPDRTWSAPKLDETWQSIAKTLRAKSEEALALLGDVPEHALAYLRITNHVYADSKAMRKAPKSMIRGVLWLTGLPYVNTAVTVRHAKGQRSFVAAHGLAVGGWIAVHAPDELDLDDALEQLCGISHGKLVRQLQKSDYFDPDVVAAHVAHAIAVGTVKPTEVSGIEFGCFSEPLEPRGLASLLRRTNPVPQVSPGTTLQGGAVGFVQDGTELAKVVRVHLGERLFVPAPSKARSMPDEMPRVPPPAPPATPVSVQRPAAPPPEPRPEPARKAKPPHPLRPLAEALSDRVRELGIRSFQFVIGDEEDEPIIDYANGQVRLAGDNAQLRRVAAELAANTIHASPAIDALAAHVVSVLNRALTDITDSNETFALGVLLASPRSAGRRQSRRSS